MKKILIMTMMLVLAGCQNAPQGFTAAPFNFEVNRIAPIRVNVARIVVIEHYKPPMRAPFVEHEFPVLPANAVRKWVDTRLAASGTSGVLEVLIEDASVKEVPLVKTEGIKGLFTNDQDARYDAKLNVTFRVFTGTQAISNASGDVVLSRSRTISEKATVNERQAIYHQMLWEMMLDFERESNARFASYFAPYLK